MQSPKRFESEQEILDEINRAKRLATENSVRACGLEQKLKEAVKRGAPEWVLDDLNMAIKRATRGSAVYESRCTQLGEKLSEFRTMLIPGLGITDLSIPRRVSAPKMRMSP